MLEDINFKAEKGDIVGIIGKNGAGKTTLLKLIAGMLVPDKGEIYIKGKVSALMELGAGFNPEFTGIENISLNAAIYGLSEADLKQRMGDIIEFAGLDKFINAPIKYYSQGMYMRLAFALAIYVEPDILLIDDILAVGDEEAQRKCIKKIFELKKAGKTIILVSHDMNMVSKLCNRLILLEKGKIVQEGGTAKVSSYYLETVGDEKGIAVLEKEGLRVIFNNGKVTLDYNGFSFTKAIGGYASLFMSSLNSWSSSFNLSWEVKNFGTDKIIAEGKSYEGVLSQIWTLQIEKNCLQWQTEIREEGIKQPHIDLLLIPQYKRWQTLDKISDFPLFASKSNWQDLGLNSCSDAVLGVSTVWQNQDCPGLIFEQEDKDISFKLFNTGYEQEARVIQWESGLKNKNRISIKIFPKKEKFTEYIENAKQKLLFEQQAELVRLRAQHTISCGGLRLYADVKEKSLRLYYKDKEITKGEGLHNSFLVNNVWYTLSSGVWQIKNVSEKELNLILNYETLPLFQIWTLICKEDTLMVKIEVKFNKPISVSNQLTLLQVHDGYKKWESVYEHGNLLNERFINDIVPVRLKDNKISKILLKSKNNEDIPELSFNVFSQLDKRTMNIYKYKRKNDKGICLNSSLTIFKKERLIKP
ncbi:MAG: ABC transporter ATP-binding protein, partial [Candidatus Omnitrophica bacterium]|nr:ABC transporter ATP-binding protein [Candidatus Omnitrophota bacterium]